MDDPIEELRGIPDPVLRWERLLELEERVVLLRGEFAAARTEIVIQLRSIGLSLQQIADRLQISKSRVAEIEKQRTA